MNAKFVNRSSEKRFFDPKTVLDRDEGGELEQRDYELGEFEKDLESGRNMKAARRRDQLDNSVSAWKGELSTNKFDYPDTERDNFARQFADRYHNDPYLGSDDPADWARDFKTGRYVFDQEKEFHDSHDGKLFDSENFEMKFKDPKKFGMEDDVASEEPSDTDDDAAWVAADYESSKMFGESIDRLAKATGKIELCEAVKKLYAVCHGSEK